jgi:gliding motility-associated-like protein
MWLKFALVLFVLLSFSFSSSVVMTAGNDDACITYIPTAISPNGDGINERFEVRHTCLTAEMILEIFDRDGRMVYSTSGSHPSWGGLIAGVPAPSGRYSWRLHYRNQQGTDVHREGAFVLVR